MTNENIQGPVQLAGRGFIDRPNDKYQPGEYKRLVNIDITNEGTLTNRLPAQGVMHNASKDLYRCIGYRNSYAYVVGEPQVAGQIMTSDIYMFGGDNNAENYWQMDDFDFTTDLVPLLDGATASVAGVRSNKKVSYEGVFDYNGYTYLIVYYTFNVAATTTRHGALLLLKASNLSYDSGSSLPPPSTWVYTGSVIDYDTWDYSSWSKFGDYSPGFKVQNYFVYKERLWIASGDTVYFSAATVPDNFTVPSGGFFKFPADTLKKIIYQGDLIYVFCDSRIHVIQYDTDPNLDASVSLVSDVVGAEDAVVYGDSIYSIKINELYSVRGLNVTKVMDLKLGYKYTKNVPIRATYDGVDYHPENALTFDVQLKAFNGSLYVTPRLIVPKSPDALSDHTPYNSQYGMIGTTEYLTGSASALFRINTETGAVSEYVFGPNGVPFDTVFIPNEDNNNQTRLVVIAYDNDNARSRVFSLGSRPTPDYYLDTVSNDLGLYSEGFNYAVPNYFLWLRHFAPDNLRYAVKKFRRMEVEANLPNYWDIASDSLKALFTLAILAGSSPTDINASNRVIMQEILQDVSNTSDDPDEDTNISDTYIYGINQRARHVDILMGTYFVGANIVMDTNDMVVPPTYTKAQYDAMNSIRKAKAQRGPGFEISDMRTLWSYTARLASGPQDKS